MKRTTITKSLFILILFQVCSLVVSAQQTEVDSINLPALKYREYPLNIEEQFRQELRRDLLSPSMEIKKPLTLNFPLQYETPTYQTPKHNLHLDRISFPSYPVYSVGDNSVFYMNQTQDLMPGVASANAVTAGFKVQATENWYIDISNSANKYRDFTGIYNDYTINASSYISLSDNFGINAFGSYSTQSMNNAHAGSIPYSPFAPNSYFGGSVEFKITDKFGIEAGMLRQYNAWRRRWENVYFVAPKFYK